MKVLRAVTTEAPEGVVVGDTSFDDAAVLRWPDESVDGPHLVQTVDFITAVVDDPRTFGAVAAANALSDVYAMGGRPRFAMVLAGFPSETLPLWVLEEILAGGADKVAEAGAFIAGGHTVNEAEPRYGLAVTGEVWPENLVTQAGAQLGDALILSKALGTGLAIAALRRGALSEAHERAVVESMLRLNAKAAEHMGVVGANACTDVTGFGLLGHALTIAKASNVTLVLDGSALPALPGASALAASSAVAGASLRNLEHVEPSLDNRASGVALRLALDPQTSGGLLVSVAAERASELLQRLADDDIQASRIGEVVPGEGTLRLEG